MKIDTRTARQRSHPINPKTEGSKQQTDCAHVSAYRPPAMASYVPPARTIHSTSYGCPGFLVKPAAFHRATAFHESVYHRSARVALACTVANPTQVPARGRGFREDVPAPRRKPSPLRRSAGVPTNHTGVHAARPAVIVSSRRPSALGIALCVNPPKGGPRLRRTVVAAKPSSSIAPRRHYPCH